MSRTVYIMVRVSDDFDKSDKDLALMVERSLEGRIGDWWDHFIDYVISIKVKGKRSATTI